MFYYYLQLLFFVIFQPAKVNIKNNSAVLCKYENEMFIFLFCSLLSAVCRRKNASKFKRSLKLAISSDDINNRHKVGLRKVFRQKRHADIDDDVPECK